MAVISCKRSDEVTADDTGEQQAYKEVFKVKVADGDQPANIVLSNHPDVPKVGDPHPVDPRATLKKRSISPTKNRTEWLLNVEYVYSLEAAEDGGGGGGSGMQVVSLSGGAWSETIIVEQDQKGKAYRNSAGDSFEKETTIYHPTFNITARSREFLVPRYIYDVGSVNNSSWSLLGMTFQKNVLMFADFNFNNLENGWWEYNFQLNARLLSEPVKYDGNQEKQKGEDRSAGWVAWLLDAGYRELDDNGALIPIIPKDQNGKKTSQPVSSPWPLDGGGKALKKEDFEKAQWLPFNEYPATGFYKFRFDFDSLLTPEALRGIY